MGKTLKDKKKQAKKTLNFKKSEKLYRRTRRNYKVWHSDYANGKTTYYGTTTEYGFQMKKRFARRSYHNITIFLMLVMGEQLKLLNCYAEHITGQNYVMKSKDMSKTATRAKG